MKNTYGMKNPCSKAREARENSQKRKSMWIWVSVKKSWHPVNSTFRVISDPRRVKERLAVINVCMWYQRFKNWRYKNKISTKRIIWRDERLQRENIRVEEWSGWFFAPTTWNNCHGEAADNLQRAHDSSIPLAGHFEVERPREREHFCVFDILLSLWNKKRMELKLSDHRLWKYINKIYFIYIKMGYTQDYTECFGQSNLMQVVIFSTEKAQIIFLVRKPKCDELSFGNVNKWKIVSFNLDKTLTDSQAYTLFLFY